jgi:sulfur dioxygenase
LKNEFKNLKLVVGEKNKITCADILLKEEEISKFGTYEIKGIETPGHTTGCISLLFENKIFSGDSLMIRGVGRCDFQEGNSKTLFNSIQKLYNLPNETLLYVGHNYMGHLVSSIGEEKKYNKMIKKETTQKEFIENVKNLKLDLPKKIDKAVPANMFCGK